MNQEAITTETLDHHGLVAATIQDLGIIEKIDKRIEKNKDPRRIVSTGKSVAALILNGLGFTNRRLYLVSQFFENKPLDRLLGDKNIKPENLNDDALGKALDEIAEYGTTKLFAEIAFEIARDQGLFGKFGRFDTSTISVEGSYDNQEGEEVVNITYGYSKNHRSDLKQMTILLGMTGKSNLPFWFETLDGNKSDKQSLHESVLAMKNFYKQIEAAPDLTCVADAALYNAKNLLAEQNRFFWITRVPETIKETRELLEYPANGKNWQQFTDNPKYSFYMHHSNYGGVEQRWMIIHSEEKFKKERKTFKKNIKSKKEGVEKEFKALSRKVFACREDAIKKLNSFKKKNPLFEILGKVKEITKYASGGRPKKNKSPQVVGYAIEGSILINESAVTQLLQRKGKFILATNRLDKEVLPDESILSEYKEQNSVERGFAFLKDPWFMAHSIYLKSERRISALMMIMTLCLLVYNFAQYKARKILRETGDTLPNQVKKQVQNPTLKWIFLNMEGITVVNLAGKINSFKSDFVANLNPIRKKIIALFGINAKIIYGFS